MEAIERIRFGLLVAANPDHGIEAVHVPMIVRRTGGATVLESHVSRANPIWKALPASSALAVFQGPSAYIRPGWWPTKRETGRAVPTWNYVAVHAKGRLSAFSEPDRLVAHVDALSRTMETGKDRPWSIDEAPDGYIAGLSRGIVGLSLAVDGLEGSWKMIQHHPEGNRLATLAALAASPDGADQAVAQVMQRLEDER